MPPRHAIEICSSYTGMVNNRPPAAITATLGAFGAAIAIERGPGHLGEAVVAALVDRTVLEVVQRPFDARWHFGSVSGRATAECWCGDELLRRHIVRDPVDLIDRIVGSTHHAVAINARNYTFVHAGAVVVAGRPVLLPAVSRAGKSMLVRSLLLAGAAYLSDEYAVLGPNGSVHAYRKPLSIRVDRGSALVDAESLGSVHSGPLDEHGLVVVTHYESDIESGRPAEWEPMTPGSLGLVLLEHCVTARSSPITAFSAISAFIGSASGLSGPRGDADEAAGRIVAIARGDVSGVEAAGATPDG